MASSFKPKMYLPPHGQSRRSLLKKGLFGGVLLAVGGSGLLAIRGSKLVPLPAKPLSTFDERQYAIIHAIAARMVVPMAGFPTVEQVGVAYNADQILRNVDPAVTGELLQLIGLFENAFVNWVWGGRTKPFTQLSEADQDAALHEMQNSRLTLRRTGFQALRSLVLAAYYGSPMTWGAVGYPGPPQGFHDPDAPIWKGGGAPRPPGNGVWVPKEKP